jgi:hypothetical protein
MFACEVCTATFARKDYLSRHIKSFHNGIKFTCYTCLTSFTRKFKLNRHKKTAHRNSVIHYAPPDIVGQPTAISPALPTILSAPVSESWDDTVGDDVFLEALADFENQGKKIHYYSKHCKKY